MINSVKTKTSEITKESLEDLYFVKNMTLDQIGHHFGYIDRQPIMRLFKKYGIQSRSKSETAKMCQTKREPMPKDELLKIIGDKSVLRASKGSGISRNFLMDCLKHYGIKSEYFVNREAKDISLTETGLSNRELAQKLNIPIETVNYYKKDISNRNYSKQEIFDKIKEFGFDINGKSFSAQINRDQSLYNSIINLTKDHILYSKKITERIYRLEYNFTPDYIPTCKYCESTLKFYTYKLGYGNSNKNICKECIPKHCGFGVSDVSQKLFDSIFSSLSDKQQVNCKYHSRGGEFIIKITKEDKEVINDENLNKNRYHIDFIIDKKIIEFDGVYWHKEPLKETAKDNFLNYKGYGVLHIDELDYYNNPEKTLLKCMNFLNQ